MTRALHRLKEMPAPEPGYFSVKKEKLLAILAAAVDVRGYYSRRCPGHKRACEQIKVLAHVLRERGVEVCEQCGCTDADCSQCIKRTGMPCFWVRPMLCSACAGIHPILGRKAAETQPQG